MSKVEQVKHLASIGYPGDIIAKIVAGKELTPEDEQRIERSVQVQNDGRNIDLARQLRIL